MFLKFGVIVLFIVPLGFLVINRFPGKSIVILGILSAPLYNSANNPTKFSIFLKLEVIPTGNSSFFKVLINPFPHNPY